MNKVTLYRWEGKATLRRCTFVEYQLIWKVHCISCKYCSKTMGEMETLVTTNKENLLSGRRFLLGVVTWLRNAYLSGGWGEVGVRLGGVWWWEHHEDPSNSRRGSKLPEQALKRDWQWRRPPVAREQVPSRGAGRAAPRQCDPPSIKEDRDLMGREGPGSDPCWQSSERWGTNPESPGLLSEDEALKKRNGRFLHKTAHLWKAPITLVYTSCHI